MSRRAESTIATQLADWVGAIRAEDLPEKAVGQAKLLLLDTIGCGFAGLGDHAARAVVDAVTQETAQHGCTILGTGRKSTLPNAVLANGALIRGLDLNDYVVSSDGELGGHPSDNIPVALAAGEVAGRAGRDVLASIIFGYELYARFRRLIGRGTWDGVTASGIAAPAMAGYLLGLERSKLAHAIALGAAFSATPSIVRRGHVSAAKSIANALVAQRGAQAALLAAQGVTGPLAAIEHPQGLQSVFADGGDSSALTAPLGTDSYVMQAHVKPYPCVATAQGGVAAGLQLHRLLAGAAHDIERVTVSMADYPTVRDHQADKQRADPQSREAADHSLPFVIAVAILDGAFGPRQFEGERWNDPTVRRLMARLAFRADAELRRRAPGSYAYELEAFMKDGRHHRVEMLYPPGFSRAGLDADVVREKFSRNMEGVLPDKARDRIIEASMDFDRTPTCRTLLGLIGEKASR